MALDDILVTVGADISNYVNGLERAAQATKNFENNLNTSGTAVKNHSNAVNGQSSTIEKAGRAYGNYSADVARSNTAIQEQGVDLKEADSAYASYMGSVQKAGSATRNQKVDLDAADAAYDEYIGSVIEANKVSLAFATGIARVAGAVTLALAGLVAAAASFESAFIGVEKTVEGTPEQFAKLETEIRGLSKVMPQSANEIAGVAEEAGRLGIKREDIAEFSKTMIMMGDTTDMSSSQAAQSMARLMNIMGTSESEVENLGSAITHMGNNAAASESEILEMSRRLAGASQQVGMTESEVVAMAASMAELGIRAEAGGTAMQKTLLTMNTAVMEGGEELDTFAGVAGMTADEFKQAFEQDAKQAVIAFIAGLDDVSASGGDVASVLGDVSLNNERTMDTLLRLSSSHEELSSNMDLSANAFAEGSALADEADKRYQSLHSVLTMLWNRVKDVAITFGQPLMEAFKDILGVIEPILVAVEMLASAFDSLSPTTQKIISHLVILVTTVTGLLSVMAAVNAAWGIYAAQAGIATTLTFSLAGAKTVAAAAAGALGAAIRFALGPVGLLITAVGGLIAGVTWLVGWLGKASQEEKELAEETDELADSTDSLNDSIDDSRRSHAENLNEVEANSNANKELINDIHELAEAEKLSSENKTVMNAKIKDLNGNIEGLNLAYDEQSESLNMSKDALQDRIDLMENEAKLTASQERMTEITEERNKAEMKLEEINKHREKLNELTGEHGTVSSDTKEKIEELDEQEKALKENHKELGLQYEVVSEQMTEAQENVTMSIAEGVKNMSLSYEDLSDSQQELVDDMVSGYEEIKGSATDMFEKIPEEAEVSAEKMVEILEHNIESTQNWSDNLDLLAEEGASHLVDHFKELGPEHAAELQAIIDDDSGKMEELEALLGEGAETSSEAMLAGLNVSDDVKELLGAIIRDGSESFRQEFDAANFEEYSREEMEKVAKAIEEQNNPTSKATSRLAELGVVNPFFENLRKGEFGKHGKDIMEGAKEGIDSKKSALEKVTEAAAKGVDDSYTSFMQINSPSRLFYSHGENTIQGLMDGIDNLTGGLLTKVGGLFSDMLGKTDDGLSDVSSRSDKGVSTIDRIFGKMPGNTSNSMIAMYNKMKAKGANQASYMSRLPNRLTSPFNTFTSTLSSIASNAMGGMRSGLAGGAGAVLAKARSIANNVASTMRSALKVKSPSRVTMSIGEDTTEGMRIGLADNINKIKELSRRIADAATPEQPRLAGVELDYNASGTNFRTLSGAVNGTVDVNTRDELLVNAIRELRNDLSNLRVDMNGREVGRLVEPHVSENQDRKKRINGRFSK